jgi:hypothetical protein
MLFNGEERKKQSWVDKRLSYRKLLPLGTLWLDLPGNAKS